MFVYCKIKFYKTGLLLKNNHVVVGSLGSCSSGYHLSSYRQRLCGLGWPGLHDGPVDHAGSYVVLGHGCVQEEDARHEASGSCPAHAVQCAARDVAPAACSVLDKNKEFVYLIFMATFSVTFPLVALNMSLNWANKVSRTWSNRTGSSASLGHVASINGSL